VDEGSIRDLPGVVRVVRSGNFLGVVAEREEQAIQAAQQLKVTWQERSDLPGQADLFQKVRSIPAEDKVVQSAGDVEAGFKGAAKTLEATYYRPFMAHASIGPSCAVADVTGDG